MPPADPQPAEEARRRHRLLAGFARHPLLVAGGVLIVLGLAATAIATLRPSRDSNEEPRSASAATATANDAIIESPPIPAPAPVTTTVGDPTVPAAPPPDWTPTVIRVPKIEIDAPIDPLGVDAQNALQVPSDPTRVGWWSGGSSPGEPDPSVLVGHLDSSTGPAVFFRLELLVPGDLIEVDRADGTTARFMIERLESHPKDAFPTLAVYGPTEGSTLRLVTCFGAYDPVQSAYENNLVIYANLMP